MTAPNGRPAPPAPSVVAATARKGDIDVTLDELGTVMSLATVTVQTQISGQLMQVAFHEGQSVKQGDFLAQIDPRPFQATLEQDEGQLMHDEAALKEAETDLARFRTLARQDSIALQQAQDQAYLAQQDAGTVQVDRAMVENAKLNLAYCHIVSPVTGRIGLRLVDPGNYVQVANSTGIAVIAQMQPITVVFTLAEDDLPAVLDELHRGHSLQATAYDRSGMRKLAVGQVYALDSTIDPTTGTVKLRAQFANRDETLFPDQFVNVVLLVKREHGATVIPTAAVQRGAPGTFVYLVKPDNRVAVRPIALGATDDPLSAVLSGLQPGDRVVVDGADKLSDGMQVSLRAERDGTGKATSVGATGVGNGERPTGQRHPRRS